MRNLLFALILANLAFAAWHAWFAPAEPVIPARRSGTPTIALTEETPAGERRAAAGDRRTAPAGAGSTAGRIAAAPSRRTPGGAECVSVGPFEELSHALDAGRSLRESGYDPVRRETDGEIWEGYWVYIDRIPTRADAERIVAALGEAGIADAGVARGDNDDYRVSLGIYSEMARGGRRLADARQLGYEPTIANRTGRGRVYWVDVMLADDDILDFDPLWTQGRIVRLEQRPCEDTRY